MSIFGSGWHEALAHGSLHFIQKADGIRGHCKVDNAVAWVIVVQILRGDMVSWQLSFGDKDDIVFAYYLLVTVRLIGQKRTHFFSLFSTSIVLSFRRPSSLLYLTLKLSHKNITRRRNVGALQKSLFVCLFVEVKNAYFGWNVKWNNTKKWMCMMKKDSVL